MPNQRSADQQLVAFALDKRLLVALDRAARGEGRDRSTFIRLALVDELKRRGQTELDDSLAIAPARHKVVYPATRPRSVALNESNSAPPSPKTFEAAARLAEEREKEREQKLSAPVPILKTAAPSRRKPRPA